MQNTVCLQFGKFVQSNVRDVINNCIYLGKMTERPAISVVWASSWSKQLGSNQVGKQTKDGDLKTVKTNCTFRLRAAGWSKCLEVINLLCEPARDAASHSKLMISSEQ